MPPSSSTVLYKLDPQAPDPEAITAAARAIREGRLVAFPTETVYGLGADALNPEAVQGIFTAKDRPADNPLIVHIASPDGLERLVSEIPDKAEKLASAFWPGPLTLVLPRSEAVPPITSAGLSTVAVRMPSHPVALALIAAAGTPIAAPSANRSGSPSPTRAQHVMDDLGGRVAILLDGGPCDVGVESTVIDVTVDPPVVLRPGGVTLEALEEIVGIVARPGGEGTATRRSPGTRHKHYAPKARVVLAAPSDLTAEVDAWLGKGYRVAVMASRRADFNPAVTKLNMAASPIEYARTLFASLRALDSQGFDIIVVETLDDHGVGMAVMDRLRRAAESSTETMDSCGSGE